VKTDSKVVENIERRWVVVQVKSALGPVFRSVGLTRQKLDGKTAAEAIQVLRRGVEKLEAQPYLYPALEAVKEWGPNKDKPIDGLKRILASLEKHPNDGVKWSDGR